MCYGPDNTLYAKRKANGDWEASNPITLVKDYKDDNGVLHINPPVELDAFEVPADGQPHTFEFKTLSAIGSGGQEYWIELPN